MRAELLKQKQLSAKAEEQRLQLIKSPSTENASTSRESEEMFGR